MGKQMEDNGKAAKSAIVRLDKFLLPSGWFADRNDRVASSKLLQITIDLITFSAVADAVVAGGKMNLFNPRNCCFRCSDTAVVKVTLLFLPGSINSSVFILTS